MSKWLHKIIMLIGAVTVIWAADAPAPKKKKEKSEVEVVDPKNQKQGYFVNMPTFMIPIVQREDFDSFYIIKFMLEFDDQLEAVKFRNRWPELKDAIIRDLYGVAPILAKSNLTLSEEFIRERVPKIVMRVVKKGNVKIHVRRIEKRQMNRGDAAEF